jgi:hypothetical protein
MPGATRKARVRAEPHPTWAGVSRINLRYKLTLMGRSLTLLRAQIPIFVARQSLELHSTETSARVHGSERGAPLSPCDRKKRATFPLFRKALTSASLLHRTDRRARRISA